jgi:hypothetical protein
MARIRSIKPEFPQSETIGALSRDARLLFIQLWTIVDDSGRARAASRMLASLLYPYDGDAPKLVDKWLGELEEQKCIRRYVVEGSTYLEIINWLKHQKIDRPSPSRLPEYREGSTHPREDSRGLDADLGPRTVDQDLGSKNIRTVGKPTRPDLDEKFLEFKKAYPKRKGGNPWTAARKVWESAIKRGVDPAAILGGLRRFTDDERKNIGTPYIPQAVKWLRDERWLDYGPVDVGAASVSHIVTHGQPCDGKVYIRADTEEWDAWCIHLRQNGGHDPPRYFHGGWKFPSRWPPKDEPQARAQ